MKSVIVGVLFLGLAPSAFAVVDLTKCFLGVTIGNQSEKVYFSQVAENVYSADSKTTGVSAQLSIRAAGVGFEAKPLIIYGGKDFNTLTAGWQGVSASGIQSFLEIRNKEIETEISCIF